jgi:hypothetical protein
MVEPHQDPVELDNPFKNVCYWLQKNGQVSLITKAGTNFDASATICKGGEHSGEKVIRFFQNKKEYGRAYECCWGRYYNCNRTRIGMYCAALDSAL